MAEEIMVLCPWCNKGEVFIEGGGNGNVSIMCPRCSHCFKLRLHDCSTVRIQPHRKLPQAAAKIYHVKGALSSPIKHKNITD